MLCSRFGWNISGNGHKCSTPSNDWLVTNHFAAMSHERIISSIPSKDGCYVPNHFVAIRR